MSMTDEQIFLAAGEYMEATCQRFQDKAELLRFVSAVAAISLSIMESLGGEEQLKEFIADATGPDRLRADVMVMPVQ